MLIIIENNNRTRNTLFVLCFKVIKTHCKDGL